jgi:xanthine dehydrogenase accessory factor
VRAELLKAVVRARAENRPVVLVRALDSAERWLIDADGRADAGGLPSVVLEQCRLALRRDGASTIEAGGRQYLLQTLSRPYRLIVVGAVHIAQALIPMARQAGYETLLIDPRPAFASADRFPGTEVRNDWPQDVMPGLMLDSRASVVTLSHDPKIDEPALAAALESEAFYIGALGSKKNHANRIARLAERGFGPDSLARIAGPIGLPLGGRAPAEIAVAILAQIIQARYRLAAGED